MILGVPFALLAALWLTWQAHATADGDPTARGIAITVALVVAIGGAYVIWRARTATAVAIGLAFLGASAGMLRGTIAVRDVGAPSPVDVGVVAMRATVRGDPEWRGSHLLVPVQVNAIARAPGKWEAADGPATMVAPATAALTRGTVIEAATRSPTRTSFTVREIRHLGTEPPSRDPDPLTQIRKRLTAPIAAWLPEPEASLATGILLGDRTGVPTSVRAAFNATGAVHLVAISGWNVSLVAATIGWLMTRGRPRRRLPWQVARAVATSVALWAFVALVGATGSVLRAAVMAQFGLFARMTERRAAVAGTLLWGAVALTMVDPPTLDDIGWQLSFLGAAGLVWLSPWIEARMTPPAGTRWAWLVPKGVREAIAASFAAQACVLPVVAGSLGSVPLLGVIATTPGLLLIPPLMATGAALSTVGAIQARWLPTTDWLLAPLATLAWVPTTLLVRLVEWAAMLPGTSTSTPPWHPLAVVAYLVGLSLLVFAAELPPGVTSQPPSRGRAGTVFVGLGTAVVAILFVTVPEIDIARAAGGPTSGLAGAPVVVAGPGPNARVIVPALDGQPDGTLAVIAAPGGPRVMIGGGPTSDAGVHALGRSIRPWDRTIDAMVMTSADVPSSMGVARAIARYPVGTIVDLTDGSGLGLMSAIRAQAQATGVAITGAENGVPVVVGDASQVPSGPCPATLGTTAVIVPIGPSAARTGMARGPAPRPAVAVRACAGWADVTLVPDVTGAAMWLANAPASETFALVAPSGRDRWLVVPWRGWRSDALDAIREATGASLVVVQGAPEPWRAPAVRPATGNWWIAALDGLLDVGKDR